MKKFYLIFAAAVTAALLLGCPSTTQNNIETEVTDNGTGGNNGGQGQGSDNGGQGQGSDNKAPVITARITAMPKVTYIEGETFDLTGIRVTVYSDGKAAADLTNDAVFRYDAPDMSNIGTTDVEISFDYRGETLNVTLTINIEEDKTHGYTVEILDETKTRLPRGGKPFSADGVYYQLYDPTGNTDFGYGFLTKTVSDTDTSKLGKQTVTVTFSFRPHALNEEVVLTTSLEIEVIEFGIFTAADITKIQWNDLKDEMNNLEGRKEDNEWYYDPYNWSKAFPDNTTDWSKVKDVTIDLADVDTVDVIGATVLKRYIDAKLAEKNNTADIHFVNNEGKTLNLDFNKLPKGITNVQFMNAVIDPHELEFDATAISMMTDTGDATKYGRDDVDYNKNIEIIPGVQLKNFPVVYNYKGYPYNSISQAFKFTSPAVVTMPPQDTTYDLTGTYKGGILGDVTIDGLENATMSGEIYKHDIKGIYNTFVKDNSSDANELPRLDINIMPSSPDIEYNNTIVGGWNIYGTQLDKIVEAYYKHGNPDDRLQLSSVGAPGFDATEYLDGGTMYADQGNAYLDTAYQLDINAALVMAQAGTSFANVEIVGNPNGSTENSEFNTAYANVRFSANMSDVSFGTNSGSKGIIDIAGPAPQNLPPVYNTAVIIRKDAVADGINYTELAYECDLRDLSDDELSRVSFSGDWIRTNENTAEYDAKIPSIQQIETGAREGITDPRDIAVSNNHASVSPKKMKEKKDANLMRAILNGKDKEYS